MYILLKDYCLMDCILSLTTIDFWLYHRGAWFVAALVPLYMMTPLLYRVLSGKYKWTVFISIIVVLMLIAAYELELENHSKNSILFNMQWVIRKIPPFVLGVAIAKDCRYEKSISVLWIVLMTVAYLLCRLCGHDEFGWLLLPFILYCLLIFCKLVDKKYNVIYRCLTFMGVVSLESYLLNISLNKLCAIIARSIDSSIFYGRYLEYSLVIIFGIMLSYYANKLSQRITIL